MNKYKFLLDLFFPNRCPCCNDFLIWNELICKKCEDNFINILEKICTVCGKIDCICNAKVFYDNAIVLFNYSGACREGILELKRGLNTNFAVYLGEKIAHEIINNNNDTNYDYIIPIPISKKNKYIRGYNQAELIANTISKKINVVVNNKILYQNNSVNSQHFLNKTQRSKNILKYCSYNVNLSNKNVILCDDVITTGNTINRCAQLLKSLGVNKILVVVGAGTKL